MTIRHPAGAVSGRSSRWTIAVETASSPLEARRECPPRDSPYRACSICIVRHVGCCRHEGSARSSWIGSVRSGD